MDKPRKAYTAEFKLKVVLESMQRDTTQEEVCKRFGISSSMLHRWRKEFQANATGVFHDRDMTTIRTNLGYLLRAAL
jgi:transposase